MKIYWFNAQAQQRVQALARHLGIDAEFIEADMVGGGLRVPEYGGLNCGVPICCSNSTLALRFDLTVDKSKSCVRVGPGAVVASYQGSLTA